MKMGISVQNMQNALYYLIHNELNELTKLGYPKLKKGMHTHTCLRMQCHIRRGTGYEEMARKNSKSQSQADGIRLQKKMTHNMHIHIIKLLYFLQFRSKLPRERYD